MKKQWRKRNEKSMSDFAGDCDDRNDGGVCAEGGGAG